MDLFFFGVLDPTKVFWHSGILLSLCLEVFFFSSILFFFSQRHKPPRSTIPFILTNGMPQVTCLGNTAYLGVGTKYFWLKVKSLPDEDGLLLVKTHRSKIPTELPTA